MREGDRLRDLKMRETGHHRLGVLLRNVEQRALQRANERPDVVDLLRADTGGRRSPPDRCASARCAGVCPRRRRARSSRRSMFRCTSSRSIDHSKTPRSISSRICARPRLDRLQIVCARMPHACSMRACASEPVDVERARRLSKATEAVKRFTRSLTGSSKRPDQSCAGRRRLVTGRHRPCRIEPAQYSLRGGTRRWQRVRLDVRLNVREWQV